MTLQQITKAVLTEAYENGLSEKGFQHVRAIKSIINSIDDMENRLVGLRSDLSNEMANLIKETKKSSKVKKENTGDNLSNDDKMTRISLNGYVDMIESMTTDSVILNHITTVRLIVNSDTRITEEKDKLNFLVRVIQDAQERTANFTK